MAYTALADVAMAYIAMAYIVMAYVVMGYIAMAYVLSRCVDIRASSGISANLPPLGPLCCTWRMGTTRGAKLHLGGTLAHVGPVGAWGSAGTHHEVQVPWARYPPCTIQPPDQAQTGSPTRTYCSLVPQGPELLILHVDEARNPRM